MSLEWSREDGVSQVSLSDQADLSIATELKAALLQAFAPPATALTIDLRNVSELHITIIQLVWVAAREACAKKVAFDLLRPNDTDVINSLIDCGLTLPSNNAPEPAQEPAA
ncbi:hypothetical protein SAMN05421819_2712 [Bryocella elongata]|uniref:STAS domain-containing protein n=1 Tax=Bryocella elongata TaxID=863522 RepID=A0A1H5ZLU0_9BACT|nr:hypothetical protein [Bryocella elongata]SEG36735.1 hypothetical protein SAMN05421819_2712 [Bryocella elongata]